MANICLSCNKRPQVANRVSNANNKTRRWILPNVRVMRFSFKGQKSVLRGAICTKCVKAGKVEKVI
ncbi:MAG: L28 family ribosomal protein [bacterium]